MKMSNKIMDNLFVSMHQLQVNLIKQPTKQLAVEYQHRVNEFILTSPDRDSSLFEFLSLPIQSTLNRLIGECLHNQSAQTKLRSDWCDLNESLISSLIVLVDYFKPTDYGLFNDLLGIGCMLLSKANDARKAASEEYQCTLFRLISTLFALLNSQPDNGEKFFQFANLTTIGLLISVLMDTLHDSNSLQVRLEALNAAVSLISPSTVRLQIRLGMFMGSFLPGVSIKLVQKFLLGENIQLVNHKLITGSLDFYARLLGLIFSDEFLLEDGRDVAQCQRILEAEVKNESKLREIRSLIVNRTPEWLSTSSERVFMLIERLMDVLIVHENRWVKLELVKFSSYVAGRCYVTLNAHLGRLFKLLVTNAVSDDETVQREAKRSIDQLLQRKSVTYANSDVKYVVHNRNSIVSISIEEVLLQLPRLMDDNQAQSVLVEHRRGHLITLYGYLKLIGDGETSPRLRDFFLQVNGGQYLNLMLNGLVSSIKFDLKNLHNFYELKHGPGNELSNYNGLATFLDDKSIYDQLVLISAYLGRSDLMCVLVDQAFNGDLAYVENRKYKLHLMFLINLLFVGYRHSSPMVEDKVYVVNRVLGHFLNDLKVECEDKCATVEAVTLNANSTEARNRLILQTCLTLEAIAATSACLNDRHYSQFLIDTLYFCLENYLNVNLLIRCVAMRCLDELAANLAYKSVQHLLSANYDYLMNELILKSNNLSRQLPDTNRLKDDSSSSTHQWSHVFVLCSLVNIADADLLNYLVRLVDDYVFAVQMQPKNVILVDGICRIGAYVTKSVRRWFPVKLNFIEPEHQTDEEILFSRLNWSEYVGSKSKHDGQKTLSECLKEVDQFFINVNSLDENQQTSNEPQNEQFSGKQDEVEEETNKEASVPVHIKLQIKFLELCVNLISHPRKEIRLRVIDLVRELSINLAEYSNEFLPLVHKLWSPICQRFTLDDLIVKAKIVSLLFDLSVLSGDFLSARFAKEFLPRLCKFMSEQAKLSAAHHKDATYVYSHSFKLQCAILDNIDKLCIVLDLKQMELETCIESTVLSYLDHKQPRKIQLLALNALKNCALIDADVVWLCLHYVVPFNTLRGIEPAEENNNQKTNWTHLKTYSSPIKLKFPSQQLTNEILFGLLDLFCAI